MQIVRWIVILAGLFFLLLGVSAMMGFPFVVSLWPNLYLLGATLMAFAIPTLWIGVTQTYKALVGGSLCTVVTFGAGGMFILRQSLQYPNVRGVGESCLYIAILALWFLFLGLRVAKRKADLLPRSTQLLFALLLTVALLQGLFLLVPLPGRFPWIIPSELSILYGWVLIGIAIYFGWCLIQPIWENGYPLLYGLLVYDALLIGPLLSLFKEPAEAAVVPTYLWFATLIVAGSGIWAFLELIGRFFTVRKR